LDWRKRPYGNRGAFIFYTNTEGDGMAEKIDLDKIYDYKEFPDKTAGRCDNCGCTKFKSSVKNFLFLRECRECGMKKSI
jgi:hypothetical protein